MTYLTREQLLDRNCRTVYRQLAALLEYTWPNPTPETPREMKAWSLMSTEERGFWIMSYDEMQTAIMDLTRPFRRNAKKA